MSSLRVIMAVSKDGYVALGPNDPMDWTGSLDKAIFKCLTMSGDGVVAAGRKTYELLPKLIGRDVKCLSKTGGYVETKALNGERTVLTYTLKKFSQLYPTGWLIGGQSVVLEALQQNLVSEVILCKTPIILETFVDDPSTLVKNDISKALHIWPVKTRSVVNFGSLTVEITKRKK